MVVLTTFSFAVLLAFILGVAGRAFWPAAWVFVGEFYAMCMALGFWLDRNDRNLLAQRLLPVVQAQQERWDKILMALYSILTTAWITLMASDAGRFHHSQLPLWVHMVGVILLAACGYIVYRVFRENTFAAPIVRLQTEREHKVISTGPYSYVRHPMYVGTLSFFIGAPLILGSQIGLYFLPLLIALLAVRIVLEERTLRQKLPGYMEYAQKVRYRMLPGVW